MPLDTKLANRLKRLKDSCNSFATAHAALQDVYHLCAVTLTIVILTLTTLLLTVALADEALLAPIVDGAMPWLPKTLSNPQKVKLCMALFAALAFLLTLLDYIFKPAAKAAGHKAAVDKYTESKYEFRELEELADVENLDGDEIAKRYKSARIKYLNRENIPTIPEIAFLLCKLWHKLKVWASDKLDEYKGAPQGPSQ